LSIILSLLLMQPAFSQDTLDYVTIAEGEAAPFSGKLLTDEALAKIISQHELELETLRIDYEAKLEKQVLDSRLTYDMLDARFKLDTEMYTNMIDNRNLLLKNFQPEPPTWKKDFRFIGGFLAGAGVTIGIAYSLDKMGH
jgi:hypothetical protein